MRAAHDEATRQGSSVSASVVRTIDDLATMWKSAAARWAVYEAGGDSMEDVGSGGDLTMGDTGNAFADAYRKHAAGVGRVRVKATYRPTVASGAGACARLHKVLLLLRGCTLESPVITLLCRRDCVGTRVWLVSG